MLEILNQINWIKCTKQLYSIKTANWIHLTYSTKSYLKKPNLQKTIVKSNPGLYGACLSSALAYSLSCHQSKHSCWDLLQPLFSVVMSTFWRKAPSPKKNKLTGYLNVPFFKIKGWLLTKQDKCWQNILERHTDWLILYWVFISNKLYIPEQLTLLPNSDLQKVGIWGYKEIQNRVLKN